MTSKLLTSLGLAGAFALGVIMGPDLTTGLKEAKERLNEKPIITSSAWNDLSVFVENYPKRDLTIIRLKQPNNNISIYGIDYGRDGSVEKAGTELGYKGINANKQYLVQRAYDASINHSNNLEKLEQD